MWRKNFFRVANDFIMIDTIRLLVGESPMYFALFIILSVFLLLLLQFVKRMNRQKPTAEKCNLNDDWDYDVVIVGSGVLGSTLAAILGRDGRKVAVVERNMKMPEVFSGELLQPGGCQVLKKLGLSECLENIDAQNVHGFVVHDRNVENISVNYPMVDGGICDGLTFRHGRFVMNLRNAAKSEKNVTYIEGNVIKLIEDSDIISGVIYKPKGEDEEEVIKAKLTVVADGCFSNLRKSLVNKKPEQKSLFVALFLEECPQTKSNYAELIITDPHPVLIYRSSGNSTRILIDMRDQKLPKNIKEYLKETIYDQLPDHFQAPFITGLESGPIKSMPNMYLPPAPIYKNGVMVLGDALNMRHAITGGGMSVALHDIALLREPLSDIDNLLDYKALTKVLKTFYKTRTNHHSFVVNVLSVVLHELVAANDEELKCMRKALFEYLKLGGECVKGPMALFSVLQPKPYLVLFHCFSVTFYAAYLTFNGFSPFSFISSLYKSICIFKRGSSLLFPLIWSEIKL